MTYFGGFPSWEAAKTGVIYKKQYIPRLTEEHIALTMEYIDTWRERGISNTFET
jgi:hypothetical protein